MILLYVACFFGGLFSCNGIPHFVSGTMGRKFPSPFAKPPGQGESSTVVNVFWGFFNFVVAYLILFKAVHFEIFSGDQVLIFGLGVLLMAFFLAHHFGKVYGAK